MRKSKERATKLSSIKTLSLFSGCGGLDLGIEGGFNVPSLCATACDSEIKEPLAWTYLPKTPFKIAWANDIMESAQKVWRYNFKEGHYELNSVELLLKEGYKFPEAELVIGGFPCQDFSVAGKRQGFSAQRGALYKAMASVLKQVQPKAFIAENVFGLLSIPNALPIIMNAFDEVGYQVEVYPLTATEYGVPQARQRLFFVGINKKMLRKKVNTNYCAPIKTHTTPVPLSYVFSDLEEPETTMDWEQQHYSKAKWYGKGRQGNIEVALSKPGPTIRAEHHGNIEFRRLAQEHGGLYTEELSQGLKERRLTIRECARIQTFPDEFHFVQNTNRPSLISASAAYKVIGNAVPPLLAYRVAYQLASVWNDMF
jgi:DNA (cytosine-5)-methyltransferase 1